MNRNVLRLWMESLDLVQFVLAVKGHHVDRAAGGVLDIVARLAGIGVDDLLGRRQAVLEYLKFDIS